MIEWSKGAEEQLLEIYFSFKTVSALERFQKQLDEALGTHSVLLRASLEQFPESAKMNPALYRQDFRSVLIGDYRLTVLLLQERLLVFSIVYARSDSAFD